jgi:hypothetical protein
MPFRVAAEIVGPAARRAAIALLSILAILAAGGVAAAQQPAKPKTPAAASPQAAQPNAGDGGKCIGIVSAIGDTFFLRKIGITVFGNGQSSVPVESWHIDDIVVSKISAFLSKGWTVRRINYPKGAFASLDGQHALFYNYDDELQGIVRRVTSSTRCDHYAVVVKGGSNFGTSNQSIYGLGIVEATSILGASDYIHALFTIRIYDGRTFAIRGQRGASIEKWNLLSDFKGPGIHGPYRAVDNSLWPQSGAAQSTKLRDGIRSLVEQALDATMPEVLRVQ